MLSLIRRILLQLFTPQNVFCAVAEYFPGNDSVLTTGDTAAVNLRFLFSSRDAEKGDRSPTREQKNMIISTVQSITKTIKLECESPKKLKNMLRSHR